MAHQPKVSPAALRSLERGIQSTGDAPLNLTSVMVANLLSDAGAEETANVLWDRGDLTCRRDVDGWVLSALLELRARRLSPPSYDPPQRAVFKAREFSKGLTWVVDFIGSPSAHPAVYVGQGVGNPDVFAQHVANCLNLNADYSASLLPVVRLLLDYQDGNRTAEQGRAYWRELRRMVAHYDAVTGKEPTE
ncbi:hypothetical protein TMCBR2_gp042c [Caulobacter phage TMCBR2]|uniref:Uncharacterized protein n=1 Tax=Caulobacter phage TMCBR2 TaxID=3025404 RepID=A0AAE9YKL0_9CAUD|nr:hypothetical protein TMCBR2_gp042c [Caulobacter phage TMCBR2]